MKKVFFALVGATVLVLTACNNKPAEGETTTNDSLTTPAVTETPVTPTVDSSAMAASGSTGTTGETGTTGTK